MVNVTYPHMMSADTEVWTRFLESEDIPVDLVWYDVHVGRPVQGQWPAASMQDRIAAGLTRKRIDVVALVEKRYWVIEVKPIAQHFAIGQVVVYEGLFVTEYEPELETWPVIVCDTVDEDVITACQRLGVVVVANL